MIITVTLHAVIDLTYTVPHFVAGATQRASAFEAFPAGKGVSVSLALATGMACHSDQQRPIIVCGHADVAAYTEFLRQHNLDATVLGGPPETRRHVTIVDPTTGSTTHVQVKGSTDYPADLVDTVTAAVLRSVTCADDVVVFSGSLPPALPSETYALMVRALKGVKCIVDTSGSALVSSLHARPFAIKPNRAELLQLLAPLAADLPLSEYRVAIQEGICKAHGVAWVLASDGDAGVLLCSADAAYQAAYCGPPLCGADETRVALNDQGCGDALVAGLAFAAMSGLLETDVQAALRHAVCLATANLLHNGAGIIDPADMARLLPFVNVSCLA